MHVGVACASFLTQRDVILARWEATQDAEKDVIVNDLRHFFLEVSESITLA